VSDIEVFLHTPPRKAFRFVRQSIFVLNPKGWDIFGSQQVRFG